MARALYEGEPVFREAIDECAAHLLRFHGRDIRPLIYQPEQGSEASEREFEALVQPLLFSFQYAMANLWISWGVRPAAVIGHSIGEYAAACVAGVMEVEDALRLTWTRGELVHRVPGGAVLAVSLSAEALRPRLEAGLSIAAINAPSMCVIAGPQAAVAALEARLAADGVVGRAVEASHAVHSSMLDAILPEFAARFGSPALKAPKIPFVSPVTGSFLRDELLTAQHWVRNLRETVNFAEGSRLSFRLKRARFWKSARAAR